MEREPGSARRAAPPLAALLAALLVIAALGCGGGTPPPKHTGPLNLLVVVVDTLRADHLGLAGYGRDTTPFLDTFAERGVRFTNHQSHASRTGPSVASLFTGLHPRTHGAVNPLEHWDQKAVLAESRTTLAERLAAAGWTTAAFVTNPNLGERFGFAQGFGDYTFTAPPTVEAVTRDALHWVAQAREPWFLYLHLMEPHSHYDAPRPYDELFVDPDYAGPLTGVHEQLDAILLGEYEPDAADREQLVALYDQELRTVDAGLEALVGELEARGLTDHTLIVLLSDHGEEFFDHGSLLHGYTLYQEQLHVPFLLVDPRRAESRIPARIAAPTRMVDVVPTLLELLDVSVELGPDTDLDPDSSSDPHPRFALQGRSLVPLLDGAEPSPLPHYAEASLNGMQIVRRKSVAYGGWKLIRTYVPEVRVELYQVDVDPRETRDLAAEHPEQVARLSELMDALEAQYPEGSSEVLELTATEREQLSAIGYGGAPGTGTAAGNGDGD